MHQNSFKKRLKLFILRPTMGQGGADRVSLILLQRLNREIFDLSLVLMRAEGEFLDDIPKDVSVYSLNASSVATAWLPLIKLLRDKKPDILFSTSSGTNIPGVIAQVLAGCTSRLILSERNILFHGKPTLKRKSIVFLKKILYRHADQIISLSEGVKNDLVGKLHLDPNSISVAYSPIDIESIQRMTPEEVNHPWFQEEVPIILAAGRFVTEKDFPTLINAFARIRSQRSAKLVILGEGPLRENLQELVTSLGLKSDVWFPGFDKNPFKYMARCTIFVVSSKHEGLCTVLIQAMACGAPAISTNYEVGASEIIEHGMDGLLVPVGDVASLADSIIYLLDSPEVRCQLATKARQSVQRFGADVLVNKHMNLLLDNN